MGVEAEDASSGWTTSSWARSLDVSQLLSGVLTTSALRGAVEEMNSEAASLRLQSDVMEGRKQSATDELKALVAKWKGDMSLPPTAVVDVLHSVAAGEAENAVPTASIPEVKDELGFFKVGCEKGKVTEAVVRRVLDAHRLGGLTPSVWDAIERLQGKQSKAEILQEKFTMSGVGMLSYSGLNTFFGGLEAKIGAPDPKIEEAMKAEHLESLDSQQLLETSNYEIQTTSEIEYKFVVMPDQMPPTMNGKWPIEDKLHRAINASIPSEEQQKLLASGAKPRHPMKIDELHEKLKKANTDLEEMQEPPVEDFEAFGARLYTGPLFVKYNGVLRGLDSEIMFLRTEMIRLCCPQDDKAVQDYHKACEKAKVSLQESPGTEFDPRSPTVAQENQLRDKTKTEYDDACKLLNKYTTTLHAINSCIIKLSKLTVASRVYRGVGGRMLPKSFWEANKYGVRGGIEGAFMSTTLDEKVAKAYAADGAGGFVFEIQMGMIDRGADISFLSQYPHEREILFAPLTGIEVQNTQVEGDIIVVSSRLSVNLNALTIDKVIAKRRNVVENICKVLVARTKDEVNKTWNKETTDAIRQATDGKRNASDIVSERLEDAFGLTKQSTERGVGIVSLNPNFFNEDSALGNSILDAIAMAGYVRRWDRMQDVCVKESEQRPLEETLAQGYLSFEGTELTLDEGHSVAALIGCSHRLQTVNLRRTELATEGWLSIASAMIAPASPFLGKVQVDEEADINLLALAKGGTLDLTSLGPTAGFLVGSLLRYNSKITRLNVTANPLLIGESARFLAERILRSPSITEVGPKGSSIPMGVLRVKDIEGLKALYKNRDGKNSRWDTKRLTFPRLTAEKDDHGQVQEFCVVEKEIAGISTLKVMVGEQAYTNLKDIPLCIQKVDTSLGITEGIVLGGIIENMNFKLKVLDLQSNALQDDGGVAIVEALCEGKQYQLEILNLSDNGLGPPVGMKIGEYLPIAKKLRGLLLTGNRFAEGAAGLTSGVQKAVKSGDSVLDCVEVSPNFSSPEGSLQGLDPAARTQKIRELLEGLVKQAEQGTGENIPSSSLNAPNLWDELMTDVYYNRIGKDALDLLDEKLGTFILFEPMQAGTITTDHFLDHLVDLVKKCVFYSQSFAEFMGMGGKGFPYYLAELERAHLHGGEGLVADVIDNFCPPPDKKQVLMRYYQSYMEDLGGVHKALDVIINHVKSVLQVPWDIVLMPIFDRTGIRRVGIADMRIFVPLVLGTSAAPSDPPFYDKAKDDGKDMLQSVARFLCKDPEWLKAFIGKCIAPPPEGMSSEDILTWLFDTQMGVVAALPFLGFIAADSRRKGVIDEENLGRLVFTLHADMYANSVSGLVALLKHFARPKMFSEQLKDFANNQLDGDLQEAYEVLVKPILDTPVNELFVEVNGGSTKFVGNEKLAKAFDELVPYLDKADSYAREAIDDVQASSSPAKGIFNKVWSMGKRFKASVVGVLEGMQADKELTKEDFLDLIKNDVVTDMAVVENFVEWGMKMGYHYVNQGPIAGYLKRAKEIREELIDMRKKKSAAKIGDWLAKSGTQTTEGEEQPEKSAAQARRDREKEREEERRRMEEERRRLFKEEQDKIEPMMAGVVAQTIYQSKRLLFERLKSNEAIEKLSSIIFDFIDGNGDGRISVKEALWFRSLVKALSHDPDGLKSFERIKGFMKGLLQVDWEAGENLTEDKIIQALDRVFVSILNLFEHIFLTLIRVAQDTLNENVKHVMTTNRSLMDGGEKGITRQHLENYFHKIADKTRGGDNAVLLWVTLLKQMLEDMPFPAFENEGDDDDGVDKGIVEKMQQERAPMTEEHKDMMSSLFTFLDPSGEVKSIRIRAFLNVMRQFVNDMPAADQYLPHFENFTTLIDLLLASPLKMKAQNKVLRMEFVDFAPPAPKPSENNATGSILSRLGRGKSEDELFIYSPTDSEKVNSIVLYMIGQHPDDPESEKQKAEKQTKASLYEELGRLYDSM